jgi:hypothetical protein
MIRSDAGAVPTADMPPTRRERLRVGGRMEWFGAFVVLNLVDLGVTIYILRNGGAEANPIGQYILVNYGWASFTFFKLIQCGIVVVVSELLYQRKRAIGRAVIAFGCAVYLILMSWDVFLLLHLKRPH